MNDTTIEWTDLSWNPATGCTPVSEGCANCYARRMAQRLRGRFGYPTDEPFRVTLHPERLEEPLSLRKPRRIFVCSMGDLFHPDVPGDYLDEVFDVMERAPQHTFILLTKRPERMALWMQERYGLGCERFHQDVPEKADGFMCRTDPWGRPSHVWVGVTCENQAAADERIPILLQTPAAVRWVSVEPMLGPVDFGRWLVCKDCARWGVTAGGRPNNFGGYEMNCGLPQLNWVVCGGETGPGARPMHPDWVRSLRDQCQAADVPFLLKHRGEYLSLPELADAGITLSAVDAMNANTMGCGLYRVGRKRAGRLLDGREWNEYPRFAHNAEGRSTT